jgi:uncharacterized repeat protein (TIGR02543 family)
MKKTAINAFLILLISNLIPQNFSNFFVHASSIPLRYSQENLGTLQTLSDFNISKNSLNFNVNLDQNKGIVMTTAGGQASSVFLKEQMAVNQGSPGFSTFFVMNVYRLNPGPADGYVFVISANSNSLGAVGGGLGYSGILNSLGVEFDFYDNGGENMASSDVFTNGTIFSTPGTVFDPGYLSKWSSTNSGSLVRAFHTWIEYDYLASTLELRVAPSDFEDPRIQSPSRPLNPLIQKNNFELDQISEYFYAGFTAATGGQMQQMTLKSWFFSPSYIAGGIDPWSGEYIVDTTPPSQPNVAFAKTNDGWTTTVDGGTDDIELVGYQYRTPFSNWITYTSPFSVDSLGSYQIRSLDRAGNVSAVKLITRFQVSYISNDVSVYIDDALVEGTEYQIDYEFFQGNARILEWYTSPSLMGPPITNLLASTSVINVYGSLQQYVFSISYQLNGGSSLVPLPQTIEINSNLQLPLLTKLGHTFQGWYTDSEFNQPLNTTTPITSDLELYARFTINQYQLSFVSPFHQNLNTMMIDFLSRPELPVLFQPGYDFLGWQYEESLITDLWTMPATDLTLTAVFIGLTSTILLITSHSITTLVVQSGQPIGSLPTPPEKTNYIFLGWSLLANDPSGIINESTIVENGLTIRLYPVWSKTTTINSFMLGPIHLNPNNLSFLFEISIFSILIVISIIGAVTYWRKQHAN